MSNNLELSLDDKNNRQTIKCILSSIISILVILYYYHFLKYLNIRKILFE